MNKPLVTVIIPAKNRIELVKKAINSVLSQTITDPIEIILIDDGSKPALMTRLGSLAKKIKIIRHSNSKGASISRNSGLAAAKGEYIAFLDSDDIWQENFLAISLRVLKQQPSFAGTISLSHKIYSPGIPLKQRIKLFLFNLGKNILLIFSFIFNQGSLPQSAPFLSQLSHMLFIKGKLRSFIFSVDMDYCEDWDFAANILKNYKIKIIPQRLLLFNYSTSGLSFAKKSAIKNKFYLKHIKTLKTLYPNSFYVTLFQIYTKYFLIGKK